MFAQHACRQITRVKLRRQTDRQINNRGLIDWAGKKDGNGGKLCGARLPYLAHLTGTRYKSSPNKDFPILFTLEEANLSIGSRYFNPNTSAAWGARETVVTSSSAHQLVMRESNT
ncbi:hypothetical protein J6590_057933 [Homalodisca vitripennis]|nr:hypothetical protein J6590_057933 [Homalodisca vitripennis]